MDHRPFENWLLAQEQLTPEQKRELQTHLRSCARCTALVDVDRLLKSAPMLAPVAGFASRWQARLVEQRLAQRKRQVWGLVMFILAFVSLLAVLVGPALVSGFSAPERLITSWISYWMFLFTSLRTVQEIGSVFLRVLPGVISPVWWALAASGLFGLCLLWAVSYLKLTKNYQGV